MGLGPPVSETDLNCEGPTSPERAPPPYKMPCLDSLASSWLAHQPICRGVIGSQLGRLGAGAGERLLPRRGFGVSEASGGERLLPRRIDLPWRATTRPGTSPTISSPPFPFSDWFSVAVHGITGAGGGSRRVGGVLWRAVQRRRVGCVFRRRRVGGVLLFVAASPVESWCGVDVWCGVFGVWAWWG